jgi:hypothetical protein
VEDGEVSIYSITGQKMLQQTFIGGQQIDVSKLDTGMYVVHVHSLMGDLEEKLNLQK